MSNRIQLANPPAQRFPWRYHPLVRSAVFFLLFLCFLQNAVGATTPSITSATTASGTVGTAFSYQIRATNSPTSYGASGLPAGLTLNTTSGLISGTSTAAGTFTVTLSASNRRGTGSASLTLTISAAAPVISSPATASGTAGSAFSYQITASNSPSSFAATGLPAGLAVNTATGLISGTPSAAGTSTVTLSATNAGGTRTATLTLTISAAGPPVITSATTASVRVGSTVSYSIVATGTPTSYGATGLPAGLSVSGATGLISGTPTTTGTSTVTLSATNAAGTGTATLTLTVAAPLPAPFAQYIANKNRATPTSQSLAFPASTSPGNLILVALAYDVSSATASVSDSQGNLFTAVGSQLTTPGGQFTQVFYAPNIKGGADTVKVSLSANSTYLDVYLTEYAGINPTNPINAQASAAGPAGAVSSGNATTTLAGDVIYGYCLGSPSCGTPGSGFATRSTFDGDLVEDMLAGNPGSYAATGSATGNWAMQMVALKPAVPAPAITSATTASGTVGSAFSYQITATNSPTSYGAAGLPAGLTLNSGTGLISGTPVATGTLAVTLSATNSSGTGTAALALAINAAAPVISSPAAASGTAGSAFSYQITASNSPSSFAATGLPAGLTLNTATGLISGTPSAAGTSTVTLSATNAGGTGTASLTITIPAAAPVITSATTASVRVGSTVSYSIVATGTPTSYGATGLPAGLSVSSATGLISGTPTTTGTSTVTLSATNAAGTGTATLTLTVAAPLPAPFAQYIANKNRATPTSQSLAFPASTSPGNLILVALAYDVSSATASVSDSQGNLFTAVGSQLTTPGGQFTQVFYAPNIKGGADTVKVSLSANSTYLDVYLTEYAGINPTNPINAQASAAGPAGAVSSGNATTTLAGDVIYGYCLGSPSCGTPGSGFATRSTFDGDLVEDMLAGNPGSYAATGSATGNWAMQMVALKPAVPAPAITSATTASGTVGSAFSYQITATNSPTSYGATGLPAGLSVNSSTGLISGTPVATGTLAVTLSATNSSGTGTAALALTISAGSPVVSLAPSSLTFASQAVGTTNPGQIITLLNTGNATLNIASITVSGTNASDFYPTSNCGPTVAPGVSCPINVSFTPGASGTRTGTLNFNDNAAGSPQTVSLIGTGTSSAPIASLSPSSLTFASQAVGVTSAAQTVTLNNTGNAALTLTSIAVAGSNPGDFAQSNNCGSSVAAGASCSINVTFKPTASGTRTAAVAVTDNATGSPQSVSLSGSGTSSGTTATLSPASVTFGNCPVDLGCTSQTVTLNNTGSSTLNIASITFTGADPADFTQNSTCSSSLAAGGSCNIVILFMPSAAGTRTASLSVSDNAGGSPQSASLSGVGTHDVVLNWTASPTTGIAGYNIYRGATPGGEGTTPLNPTPISEATYTDAGVTPGAKYYYIVTAVASNGQSQSAASNEASATVPSP